MNKKYLLPFLACASHWGFGQILSTTKVTSFNTGQSFSCITLDSNSNVWAGTNKKGLFYLYNKGNASATAFDVVPIEGDGVDLSTSVIQTLAADKLNNLWVGHAGSGGGGANGGGMVVVNTNSLMQTRRLIPDANADCLNFFERDGIATRNTLSIAVDDYNTVWSAHKYHDQTSTDAYILTPGSLSYKRINQDKFTSLSTWEDFKKDKERPELPYPAFTCNIPVSKSGGSRTCNAVACGKSEVWVSVYPYEYATSRGPSYVSGKFVLRFALTTEYLPAQILVYDLNGVFKKKITFDTVGATVGGVFNAICITKREDAWVGLSGSGGFAARIGGCWTLLNSANLPGIFLEGATVNQNAIWSNNGQVFIGTNKGLIVYNGVGKIDDPTSYELYTTSSAQLPSDNILGGANEKDSIQWVATDNGIAKIQSKVNFSISKDYSECGNEHINAIENQLKTDLYDRKDFHSYVIETDICTKTGPNDKTCTAQVVYNLMKNNVSYQAPSPKVFSYDNLKLSMLMGLTEEEKNQLVTNINAWKEDKANGNPYGGIKTIKQILTEEMIDKYYCEDPTGFDNCDGDGQLPFVGLFDELNRESYEAEQAVANKGLEAVVSCTEVYTLFNSLNHVQDRIEFLPLDKLFCGGKLGSVKHDPVRLYADDQNLTITNYTMEGHFLDPGKVKRFVVEECDKVKVVTIGTGLNYCADGKVPEVLSEAQRIAFNMTFGPVYGTVGNFVLSEVQKRVVQKVGMQLAKQNGNGNMILGSIMFKNIDLLLKQGFEEAKQLQH